MSNSISLPVRVRTLQRVCLAGVAEEEEDAEGRGFVLDVHGSVVVILSL